jgi:hypothetical protein
MKEMIKRENEFLGQVEGDCRWCISLDQDYDQGKETVIPSP